MALAFVTYIVLVGGESTKTEANVPAFGAILSAKQSIFFRQETIILSHILWINTSYWQNTRGVPGEYRVEVLTDKKDLGPMFFHYRSKRAWLIRNLLHEWECSAKNPTFVDWKNNINFKRARLIEGRLSVYSRLTFQKLRKKRKSQGKVLKLQENCVKSFETVPGPVRRKYWTVDKAI